MFQTNTQSESIKVSNVHSWVASNDTAVTAFAVQNTGSKAITINSISMRGLPVPSSQWYSCAAATCGTADNINTELERDYTPASVVLADTGATAFTTGAVSLNQGQATVVYVTEAGSIEAIDSGNTYSLQIQAGQAQAVQQVQVVTSN